MPDRNSLTPDEERELDEWLDGLRGRSSASTGSSTLNAVAVREAFSAERGRRLDAVGLPDPHVLERTLFELRRRDQAATRPVWRRAAPWAAAACLVMVSVLVLQHTEIQPEMADHEVLRGDQSTVLIVPDVAARQAEIEALLRAAGETPVVMPHQGGGVRIVVSATNAVLAALAQQRIEPLVNAGPDIMAKERLRAQQPAQPAKSLDSAGSVTIDLVPAGRP